jgi:hypothetical protein
VPTLADLQPQPYDIQSSLTHHVDNVRALEGVIAERDTYKQTSNDARNHEREEAEFGAADNDVKSIRAIILDK